MKKRQKGILALFILSVVWASFGLPIRFLSGDFTVLQQLYLRIIVAAVAGVVIFYKDINFRKLLTMPKKDWIILLFRIFILYTFAVTFYVSAYTLTSFATVSFLGAIPTTAVLGFILLREKITTNKIVWILVSVAGILLITVKDASHLFAWNRGDLYALIADFFFSITYIARKWHTNYLNNKEHAVFMLIGGAILLFVLSMLHQEALPNPRTFSLAFSTVIVIAGLLNVASLYLMNVGFAYVEAALASNIVSLECFWAVILGFLFYKEIPSVQAFIGGVLIVSSVVFLNKEEEKK